MIIFAYGSNMCSARLRSRVPSAVPLGPGLLEGHALRFHKRSTDGSGKANAFRTNRQDERMWGVLYEIDSEQKSRLDRAEGLRHGYDEELVTVLLGSQHISAQIYIASNSAISDELKPFTWYFRHVLAGAVEHDLPKGYIAALRAVSSVEDPDRERHAKEWIPLSIELGWP